MPDDDGLEAYLRVASEEFWTEARLRFDAERGDRAECFIASDEIAELWREAEEREWQLRIEFESDVWNELYQYLIDHYAEHA